MQQQQTSDAPEVAEEPRKKLKRPRAAQACEACRSRKVKCDESYPCSLCQRKSSCWGRGFKILRVSRGDVAGLDVERIQGKGSIVSSRTEPQRSGQGNTTAGQRVPFSINVIEQTLRHASVMSVTSRKKLKIYQRLWDRPMGPPQTLPA